MKNWKDKEWMKAYMRKAMKKYRIKLREDNKCLICKVNLKGKLKYCGDCLEKERKRNKKLRIKYLEKERKRAKIKNFNYRLKALQLISGKKKPCCVMCGNGDIRVLTINHLNGRSKKEKEKKVMDYVGIIKGRRKISDLEIRCFNCNILYEYECGRYKLPENYKI